MTTQTHLRNKKWTSLTFTYFSFICLYVIFLGLSVQTLNAQNNADFKVKGFHIDMRCQVMTMKALKRFANELSVIGVNTIVMEWGATYPFVKNQVLRNKYAYSQEEVKSFIQHCTFLGIDVIPLQNCFGHVEYILQHARYAPLKEDRKEISQVCPSKTTECEAVFTELFDEIIQLHPSKYLHIGGDETYLLGSCKTCSAKVAEEGKSKLFVEYVKVMCKIASKFGKIPIVWADIILKYPEAIRELPKEIIFVDWNYGWKRDHFGAIDNLINAGVCIWGAPSLRSHPDNQYLTKWETHFNNQHDFIPYAREAGYEGVIMTSWSTSGTYGFLYDTGWEVVDMFPIRYVYPLSGFKILISAYGESLNSKEPINPKEFVIKYAQTQFGLSNKEGDQLWNILKAPQNEMVIKRDLTSDSLSTVLSQTQALRDELYLMKPKQNEMEFEHIKLMFDMRIQYLKFKNIEWRDEMIVNNEEQTNIIYKQLKSLCAESQKNDKRFINLNNGFLYKEELQEMNEIRNKKLNILYRIFKQRVENYNSFKINKK